MRSSTVLVRKCGGSAPKAILGKRRFIGGSKGEAVLFVDMNIRNQTTGDDTQWIGFCIEKPVATSRFLMCLPSCDSFAGYTTQVMGEVVL